jgi:dTDP-4-dehydrorhamnose reductase
MTKIVVAGASGLAGSAIVRAYQATGAEVIPVSRKVVDLLDRSATFEFIKSTKPALIVDAAAKVGAHDDAITDINHCTCLHLHVLSGAEHNLNQFG